MRLLKNVTIFVFVVATLHFSWAMYSLYSFGQALRSHNAIALEPRVDWSRLRESIRGAFMVEATKQLQSSKNGMESLGTGLGMLMVDKMIDGYVTPTGLMAMMDGKQTAGPQAFGVRRIYVNGSPDAVNVEFGDGLTAAFEMEGIRWKLVSIWGLTPPRSNEANRATINATPQSDEVPSASSQVSQRLEEQAALYRHKQERQLASLESPEPTLEPAAAPDPAKVNSLPANIRLGAFPSQAAAEERWNLLTTKFPKILGRLTGSQTLVQNNSRTLYRLDAGPLPNEEAARQVCQSLRYASQACIVVPGGD